MAIIPRRRTRDLPRFMHDRQIALMERYYLSAAAKGVNGPLAIMFLILIHGHSLFRRRDTSSDGSLTAIQ